MFTQEICSHLYQRLPTLSVYLIKKKNANCRRAPITFSHFSCNKSLGITVNEYVRRNLNMMCLTSNNTSRYLPIK